MSKILSLNNQNNIYDDLQNICMNNQYLKKIHLQCIWLNITTILCHSH